MLCDSNSVALRQTTEDIFRPMDAHPTVSHAKATNILSALKGINSGVVPVFSFLPNDLDSHEQGEIEYRDCNHPYA